ncbi:Tether containing UBX domain for GLUT4 [Rhizophlyctis rosea]|nr:Tether containing UBX domain for GLUT4 [Rhizophlyctis rosea]
MASNVTVELEGEPFRKTVIKTTPAMSLRSIVDTACEKLKVGSADGWGLKHGRNTLDLALSVRFANLAAGAKLTLVRTRASSAGGGQVAIALQTDDGTRLMDKFPTTIKLWDILVHFEKKSNGSLNLTTRTGVPPPNEKQKFMKAFLKPNATVYMMPICIFMNQEYATIEALQVTTLQKAGLTSGNAVIRLLFRYTDMSLEDAGKEIAKWATVAASASEPTVTESKNSTASTIALTGQSATQSAISEPVKEESLPLARHEELRESRPSPPVEAVPSSQIPTENVGTSFESEHGNAKAEESSYVAMESETSSQDAATLSNAPPEQPLPAPDPHARLPSPMDIDEPPTQPTPVSAPAVDSQKLSLGPQTFDRDLKVFHPPKDDSGPSKIELPDDFFELTSAELKVLVAGSTQRRTAIEGAPLMTKAMREREDELRRAKYPKTLIRARFPNRLTLQVTFWSGEKVSSLYDAVRESLATPDRAFTLYVTPPFKTLEPEQTFWKFGLAPATLVYFKWSDGDVSAASPYLSGERMASLQAFPLPESAPTPQLAGGATGADKPAEQEKKKPAWLEKLQAGNGGKKDTWGAGQRLGGSSSQGDASGGGLFGDERDQQRGGSKERDGDDRGSKKPKWFKIGK